MAKMKRFDTNAIKLLYKVIAAKIPKKLSQLENDKNFQENVIEEIDVNGVKVDPTNKTISLTIPSYNKLANIEEFAQVNPEFVQKGRHLYVKYNGQITGVYGPFAVTDMDENDDLQMFISYTGSLETSNLTLTAHVYDGTKELTDNEVFLLGAIKWYNGADDPQTTARLACSKSYKVTAAGTYKCVLDGGVTPQEGSE